MRNFNDYKTKPESFFDEKFEKAGLTFHTKPFFHQKVCTYLCLKEKNFLLLADPGAGKSKVMLDAAHWLKGAEQIKKVLVLIPNVVNIPSWGKQIAEHRPELSFLPLLGSSTDRKKLLQSDADVYCINYAGLCRLVSSMQPHPFKVGKKKLMLDEQKVLEILPMFDMVVFDEVHTLKNPRSLTFKVAKLFLKTAKYRFGLTGTPFGRNLFDLWGQYYVIDHGESLGRNEWTFTKAFFKESAGYFGGKEFRFIKEHMEKLKRLMYNSAIRYTLEECTSLPAKQHIPIPLALPASTRPYYDNIKKTLKNSLATNHSQLAPLRNLWIQSRELTSGFMMLPDKETGERIIIPMDENVKMEALLALIESLPEDRKMVIFHEFIWSGQQIHKTLKEAGIAHAHISSADTKNRGKELDKFDSDPNCRYMVISTSIGAANLNLQVANYMVFYESPVSPIVRTQAEGRIHRTGQKLTSFIFDLYVVDTVEERVLAFLKEGKNLEEKLLSAHAANDVDRYV